MNDVYTQPTVAPILWWWEDPARGCTDTPLDMWFFHDRQHRLVRTEMVDRCAAICRDCQFLPECGDDVLTTGDRDGFRAGILLSIPNVRERLAAARTEWQTRHTTGVPR